MPDDAAATPLQRSLDRFLSHVGALTEREWRLVLDARLPDGTAEQARHVVAVAILTAPTSPENLLELQARANGAIDLLVADTEYRSAVGALGGAEVPGRLAQLARDAASGLLVLGLSQHMPASGPLSVAGAAVMLYHPFNDVVPLVGR